MASGSLARRARSDFAPNGRDVLGGSRIVFTGDASRMPDVPVQARTAKLRPFPEPKPPEPSEVHVFFVDPETLR